MKPLTGKEIDALEFGSEYVKVEVRSVGQSQGMREDWVEKTVYFELTKELEELLGVSIDWVAKEPKATKGKRS